MILYVIRDEMNIILIVTLKQKCLSYDLQESHGQLTLVLLPIKSWCKPPTTAVSWIEQSAKQRYQWSSGRRMVGWWEEDGWGRISRTGAHASQIVQQSPKWPTDY